MSRAETEGFIQTCSGKLLHVRQPKHELIDIDDIATALSRQPRFAGHSLKFLSVAEHCVHVSSKASPENKLTALMHDASEAYLVDVPKPIKPLLKGYYDLESDLMGAIADKFGFKWPLPDEVKELDLRCLSDEREQNMEPVDMPGAEWGNPLPALGVTLMFWSPEEAKRQFLVAFQRYRMDRKDEPPCWPWGWYQ